MGDKSFFIQVRTEPPSPQQCVLDRSRLYIVFDHHRTRNVSSDFRFLLRQVDESIYCKRVLPLCISIRGIPLRSRMHVHGFPISFQCTMLAARMTESPDPTTLFHSRICASCGAWFENQVGNAACCNLPPLKRDWASIYIKPPRGVAGVLHLHVGSSSSKLRTRECWWTLLG